MQSLITRLSCSLLLFAAAPLAQAQFTVSARDSQLAAGWMAGYANDVESGGASDSDNTLFASAGLGLVGSGTADGYYQPTDTSWSATLGWNLGHSYAIETAFGGGAAVAIEASGSSTTSSIVNAPATTLLTSSLPGNLLALRFVNPVAQTFLFEGSVSQTGPVQRSNSMVVLRNDAGAAVAAGAVHNGSWSQQLLLPAGIYTVSATATSITSGNEAASTQWSYRLGLVSAVPEPGTAALWLVGLVLGALRWRSRRGPSAQT